MTTATILLLIYVKSTMEILLPHYPDDKTKHREAVWQAQGYKASKWKR